MPGVECKHTCERKSVCGSMWGTVKVSTQMPAARGSVFNRGQDGAECRGTWVEQGVCVSKEHVAEQ